MMKNLTTEQKKAMTQTVMEETEAWVDNTWMALNEELGREPTGKELYNILKAHILSVSGDS